MEFGYWKCQGRSEVSVYVLHYIEREFTFYNPPGFDQWFEKKQHMIDNGFFCPSLPYLVDGDFKLAESTAIPVYLLRKYGKEDMLGKNTEDMARVCQIGGILEDQFKDAYTVSTNEKYKETYDSKLKTLQFRAKELSKFLGEKEYLLGYLTLADFQLHFMMKTYKWMTNVMGVEDEFEKHANLKQHSERIYNLPQLQKFFEERKQNPLPFLPAPYCKVPQE